MMPPMPDPKFPLRLRLRAARVLAGLEQTELAERMGDGYKRSTISNMESDRKRIEGIDLVRWAKATEVPVEFFFFDVAALAPSSPIEGDVYDALDDLDRRIQIARKKGDA